MPNPEPPGTNAARRFARLAGKLEWLSTAWFGACVAALALALGARILHYQPFGLPELVERALGEILHLSKKQIYFSSKFFGAAAITTAAVLLLLVVWRRACVVRRDGRLATRGWLLAYIWGGLVLFNWALDVDAPLSNMCLASLVLLGPEPWRRLRGSTPARTAALCALVWIGWFGLWLVYFPDTADRLLVLAWAGMLVPLVHLGGRALWLRDRLWLGLVATAVIQVLQLFPADHGGVQIGDQGFAYTFCELPELDKLFVTVPGDPDAANRFPDGYVAEHELSDPTRVVQHRFFGDDFSGRLMYLACTNEVVQICMNSVRLDGRFQPEFVTALEVADPERVVRGVLGDAVIGAICARDARHDAIIYASEWYLRLYRKHLADGELETDLARVLYGPESQESDPGSHVLSNTGFHEGRDSIFIGQWLSGSEIFELNRSSLELMARYQPYNGGNQPIAVDEDLNRIYVPGLWGIDVLEIPSGRRIYRKRLGLGCRRPEIDEVNDLLFVPVTASRRIWVFDRRSLRVLGDIKVGGGGRQGLVTSDGKLLGGNSKGYFYWETAAIADRLRGRRGS